MGESSQESYNYRDDYFRHQNDTPDKPNQSVVPTVSIDQESLKKLNQEKPTVKSPEYVNEGQEVSHDYDDRYYIVNNPNKKTDPIHSSQNSSPLESPDNPLTQDFYNELTVSEPELGKILDTDIKGVTLEKHDLLSEPENIEDQEFFFEDLGDTNYLETRQKLTSEVNKMLNKSDTDSISPSEVGELFDLITNNFEHPTLDKNHIQKLKDLTKRLLENEAFGAQDKAKMMYLTFEFDSIIDSNEQTETITEFKKEIANKIKLGNSEDIAIFSELIKLNSPNSTLTAQILYHILPEIQPPLENINNQISFALSCFEQSEAKLKFFDDHPHFKKSSDIQYKEINEINHYTRYIFSSLSETQGLSKPTNGDLENLLSKNMDIYSSRLDSISDDFMDHDHIIPLFRNILQAKQLGLNFDHSAAINIFAAVYTGIYLNNGPRVGEHVVELTDFCDAFGLDSLRESILNRGIKYANPENVQKINQKYLK